MPVTGFEVAVAAKVLTPLIKDLYHGSKGIASEGFNKWKVAGFATKLAKKIATTDKVKTIWSPDKDISLMSFYYPSQVNTGRKIAQVKSIADLGTENLVIEGIVGQGKSIFLRYLCLQELAGIGGGRIPLLLELRTLVPGKGLKHYLNQALTRLDLDVSDEMFDYLASSGKIVLLLDGFDELDNQLTKETIYELESLAEKYDDLQILITSRPSNEIQKSRLFSVVRLSKLQAKDYAGFLEKLSLPRERVLEIVRAIKESPRKVADLINTPLMLTLLVLVYESEKEIPSELPEFFERLFQIVFTRHDRLKAGFTRHHHSGLSERKLQVLFEAFCFMTLKLSYPRTLTAEQFDEAFKQAQHYTPDCVCAPEKFQQDITKVACLMLEDGIDLTTFLHKSIQEYYAAAFIKHAERETAELFYMEARNGHSSDWIAALSFLQEIDPYRHARYYAVPCIEEVLTVLGANKLGASDESLLNAIREWHPDLGVGYGNSSGQWTPERFGPFSLIAGIGHLQDELQTAIMMGLQEDLPSTFSESQLAESHYLFDCSDSDGTRNLKINSIFKEFGHTGICKELNNFELRLQADLREAKLLIAKEDKKKSIFQLSSQGKFI